MCRMLVDRARRFGRESMLQHLDFADAGHALFPVEPGDELKERMPVDLGGSEAAAAKAHAGAWADVVRVLQSA